MRVTLMTRLIGFQIEETVKSWGNYCVEIFSSFYNSYNVPKMPMLDFSNEAAIALIKKEESENKDINAIDLALSFQNLEASAEEKSLSTENDELTPKLTEIAESHVESLKKALEDIPVTLSSQTILKELVVSTLDIKNNEPKTQDPDISLAVVSQTLETPSDEEINFEAFPEKSIRLYVELTKSAVTSPSSTEALVELDRLIKLHHKNWDEVLRDCYNATKVRITFCNLTNSIYQKKDDIVAKVVKYGGPALSYKSFEEGCGSAPNICTYAKLRGAEITLKELEKLSIEAPIDYEWVLLWGDCPSLPNEG